MTKTTITPDMAKLEAIPPFDGKGIAATPVKIVGAGDGLSNAMAVDPEAMHLGEERYVVLRCVVQRITHQEVPDTNYLQRVHTLKAAEATIVDGDLVADHLDKQRIRIEEAQGIMRLPEGEVDPDDVPAGDGTAVDPTPIGARKADASKAKGSA